MSAYPMLNIDRARIVNEAVAVACGMTALACDSIFDSLRWAREMRHHAAEAAPPYYPARQP